MSSPSTAKLVTPISFAVDAILVAAFFIFLFGLVRSHVPSTNPSMTFLWAFLATSCISSVFWLAIQMFRVVLRAQRAAKK